MNADGSARWRKFSTMYFFHSWSPTSGNRIAYFYQDPTDFSQALVNALPNLIAKP